MQTRSASVISRKIAVLQNKIRELAESDIAFEFLAHTLSVGAKRDKPGFVGYLDSFEHLYRQFSNAQAFFFGLPLEIQVNISAAWIMEHPDEAGEVLLDLLHPGRFQRFLVALSADSKSTLKNIPLHSKTAQLISEAVFYRFVDKIEKRISMADSNTRLPANEN